MIERPNKSQHKFYYCNKCTYWFNSQYKYDKHECSHSFKSEIVCPKEKNTFINDNNGQNIKNITTADIECCVVDVTTNNCKYVIAENIPKSMGYIWQGNFEYYFGLDCIKRVASDLLEKETENNIKRNEKMVFNKEDKLFHDANNTFHICGKHALIK